MRRYLLCSQIGTGTSVDPNRPNVPAGATSWVTLAVRGGKCLVLCTLPDGTAQTTATVADRQTPPVYALGQTPPPTTDDCDVHLSIDTLTAAQKTALLTFLTNQGLDVSDWSPPDDRRVYFRWIRRKFQLPDVATAIRGYDVRG